MWSFGKWRQVSTHIGHQGPWANPGPNFSKSRFLLNLCFNLRFCIIKVRRCFMYLPSFNFASRKISHKQHNFSLCLYKHFFNLLLTDENPEFRNATFVSMFSRQGGKMLLNYILCIAQTLKFYVRNPLGFVESTSVSIYNATSNGFSRQH